MGRLSRSPRRSAEGDLDVRLWKTSTRVGILERCEIQLLKFSTVDLSTAGSGQDGKTGDGGRVHEPRQALRDVHLESLLLISNVILGDRRLEFNEGGNGGSIVETANQNGGTLDRLVLVDNIPDFIQLDSLTTELDLAILSATVDDVTASSVHRNATSLVDTLSRDEGVGEECLFGLLRLVEVSAGGLNTTDQPDDKGVLNPSPSGEDSSWQGGGTGNGGVGERGNLD